MITERMQFKINCDVPGCTTRECTATGGSLEQMVETTRAIGWTVDTEAKRAYCIKHSAQAEKKVSYRVVIELPARATEASAHGTMEEVLAFLGADGYASAHVQTVREP